MSLRYKALIAVVVLVAFLTGFLVVSSSTLFEEDARERITDELGKDKKIISERITNAADIARVGLRASTGGGELIQMLSSESFGPIRDGMLVHTEEWRADANGDIAFAVVDSFFAEDREATVLGQVGESLSYISWDSRNGGEDFRERVMSDKELTDFMLKFFDKTFEEPPEGGYVASQRAVLPVAGRVYLVVQNYIWTNYQNQDVVGIGVVMTELSREWLMRDVEGSGEDGDTTQIEKIVFAGDLVASSTLDEKGAADDVLRQCIEMGAVKDDRKERDFEFEYQGETHLGIAFSSDLSPGGLNNRPGFIAFKSLEKELAPFNQLRERVFMIGAGLGLIAAIIAYFGAYLVIAKLRRIEEATVKIREGKFDTHVEIRGRDEIGKLGKAFNDMTTGLKALGMYTHETLAKNLLDNPELLNAKSTRQEGSIFFSDIKGFTSISEKLGAEELTDQLNEYFAALGQKLREQRGYVDKFIGDSIMAFWGPPFISEGDYAVRACETALESLRVARDLRSEWGQADKPLFFQRIGIATGEVVIGNIGTDTKKNFTVIGDSVNLASRLEGANKLYGTEILVDERTHELAKERVRFREVDQIRVVGKEQPVRVFEPLAMVDDESADTQVFEIYARALKHYRVAEFEAAVSALDELLANHPDDGPANWLREQCAALKEKTPEGWEPVTTATSK